MILMIDNYDSFTYNIVQYLAELKADVKVVRNDEISIADIERLAPEKIVISPGPCTPTQAGISMQVISHFAGKIPLLGICLGHQSIGQVYGGQIVRAKKVMHGKLSGIHHSGEGVFRNLAQPFTATRYHSLVIDAQQLPDCLEVTAWTENENGEREEIASERKSKHQEAAAQRIAYWSGKSIEDRMHCAELNGLGEAEATRGEEHVA